MDLGIRGKVALVGASGGGLGLATAHSIVKRHYGTIAAQSQLGVGTTFTFYLPASEKAPGAAGPRRSLARGTLRRGKTRGKEGIFL